MEAEQRQLIFSPAEHERRLAAVRALLERRRLDALLLTTPENIFYLTGYRSPEYGSLQALVLPLEGEAFMVVPRLEEPQVHSQTWVERAHCYSETESPITMLRMSLHHAGLAGACIGYEKHCYFFRAPEQEQLFQATPDTRFADASGLVEEVRLVKSEEELEVMRASARVTECAMLAGLEAVAPGVTENDVAAEIERAMIKAGGEASAMPTFVASGWRSAMAHASFEGREIESGDCVQIEVGGCVHRYHTAMMRSVCLGAPPAEAEEAERLMQDALAVSRDMIRPGIAAGDVDIQNRYILDRFAHGSQLSTRSGYSIGIAFAPGWGEGRTFSIEAGERRFFEENMTLHLVSWLQIPEKAGLGLSDVVRVTGDGCESLFSEVDLRVFYK